MNFTEIVAEVTTITQRPDLILHARRAVNSAVNFFCVEANFARDLSEDAFTVSESEYIHSIALSEFERFRKFRYIKPATHNCMVNAISPEDIFKGGQQAKNCYYIVGSEVKINLPYLTPELLIGWFQYPPILTDLEPDFWLLEVSPFMIIDKAAATIFRQIGQNQESGVHEQSAAMAFTSARRDYKYGVDFG